jgi:hypothetical protein
MPRGPLIPMYGSGIDAAPTVRWPRLCRNGVALFQDFGLGGFAEPGVSRKPEPYLSLEEELI